MPVTRKQFARAALILSASLAPTVLIADESVCEPPAARQLPAAINSNDQAASTNTLVKIAMSEGASYVECIDGALEKGKDVLSDKERQRLEMALTNHLTQMRALAEKWNGMYTSYAARRTSD